MRLLELLRIFRTIADLPDFSDKEAMRTWLLRLCDVAGLLTRLTPSPADDAVLAFLERSIADPKLFDPIFELLSNLLADDGPLTAMQADSASWPIVAEAKAAGIDPVMIIAIIEAVVALIKLLRERRK